MANSDSPKQVHPFDTPGLHERRLLQRRVLRDVPDWWFERMFVPPAPTVRTEDRPIVETFLRDLAESVAADLSETLTAVRGLSLQDAGHSFLRDVMNHLEVPPMTVPDDDPRVILMDESNQAEQALRSLRPNELDESFPLV